MKRPATTVIALGVAAVTIVGGVQFLLSLQRDLVPVAQVVLFALLVVIVTASFDRGGQMRGCMTILSFLFAPVAALVMLLLDSAAAHHALDPALGWAGTFRLPAMLAGVVGPVALVLLGSARIRRAKTWRRVRGWMVVEVVMSAMMLALLVALFGLAWVGLGAGLRWTGL